MVSYVVTFEKNADELSLIPSHLSHTKPKLAKHDTRVSYLSDNSHSQAFDGIS